jgi:RNA polymerase sigma-70 factor (ECF subfamily)
VTDTVVEPDWDAVYARELPRIYNYFRYRLVGDALAQDLTSATFEKAWRARGRYRRDLAAFSTWLIAIARNTATDYLRRRRDELSLESLRAAPGGDTPDALYARQAELARLGALLGALPDRERELLALKYGAGLTNREIARHSGLSESNVGTILNRVVNRLRDQWE